MPTPSTDEQIRELWREINRLKARVRELEQITEPLKPS